MGCVVDFSIHTRTKKKNGVRSQFDTFYVKPPPPPLQIVEISSILSVPPLQLFLFEKKVATLARR